MFGKIFLALYVIVQILISILTEYSIKNSRFFSGFGSKTRIIRIFIYAFLAAVPVLGAFLPKSPFKFFCMELGNIWLGFFMFYSAFVVLLFPVLQIIIRKTKREDKSLVGRAFQFAFLAALIIFVSGLAWANQSPHHRILWYIVPNKPQSIWDIV